jgi:DNA-binding HxlR family transcriptional regulator
MMKQGDSRPSPPEKCPLERYLHVVSGSWVPKIIWFLRFGPRHFGDLRRDLGTISPKVLSAQLRTLIAEDLISRRVTHASPPRVEYSLTTRGKAFEIVFKAMEQVAATLWRLDAAKARRANARRR